MKIEAELEARLEELAALGEVRVAARLAERTRLDLHLLRYASISRSLLICNRSLLVCMRSLLTFNTRFIPQGDRILSGHGEL